MRGRSGVDAAIANLARQGVGGLLVANDPLFSTRHAQIIALAARYVLPASYSLREDVAAGGLISYRMSLPEQFRQGGLYTGRILKGTAPADLPVTQPTSYSLVINLKTAKTLGLTLLLPRTLRLKLELITSIPPFLKSAA